MSIEVDSIVVEYEYYVHCEGEKTGRQCFSFEESSAAFEFFETLSNYASGKMTLKEQILFDKKWFRGEAEFVRGVRGTPSLKLMSGHVPKQAVERLVLKSKSLDENMEANVFAL